MGFCTIGVIGTGAVRHGSGMARARSGCVSSLYGGRNIGILDKCPKCNSELELVADVQVCYRCNYWTRKGTARLDFAMLGG